MIYYLCIDYFYHGEWPRYKTVKRLLMRSLGSAEHSKEALELAKMQEQTLQLSHQSKMKVPSDLVLSIIFIYLLKPN